MTTSGAPGNRSGSRAGAWVSATSSRPCAVRREPGDDGCADAPVDLVHRRVQPVLALDQLAPAAAGGGQAAEEAGVDGLVDADRVHPDPGQGRRGAGEDLVLVADLAVGDQHHDPVPGRVGEQAERARRAAASSSVPPRDSMPARNSTARNRFRSVAGCSPAPSVVGLVDPVVEGEHGEPVGWRSACRRCARRPAGRPPSSSPPCCPSGRARAPRRAAGPAPRCAAAGR